KALQQAGGVGCVYELFPSVLDVFTADMKTLLVLIGLVSFVDVQGFCPWCPWRPGRPIPSKRQETDPSTQVYDVITETLTKARAGMNSTDLIEAAETVSSLADANRKEVSDEEINTLINEIASSFDGANAVSALFDDTLNFEKSKLESAFRLWSGLLEKGKQLIAQGKPDDGVLGAISKTAKAITTIIKDIGEIITYVERVQQSGKMDS
ncbi:unnamed protein product, partial [Lymnaea stagnalis]